MAALMSARAPLSSRADDADFVGDAGLADVGLDRESPGQLPDDGVGDELGRIHQPEAAVVSSLGLVGMV